MHFLMLDHNAFWGATRRCGQVKLKKVGKLQVRDSRNHNTEREGSGGVPRRSLTICRTTFLQIASK